MDTGIKRKSSFFSPRSTLSEIILSMALRQFLCLWLATFFHIQIHIAVGIIAKLLTIFSLNTQIALADEFKRTSESKSIQSELQNTINLIFSNLKQREINERCFCTQCFSKVKKLDKYCQTCGYYLVPKASPDTKQENAHLSKHSPSQPKTQISNLPRIQLSIKDICEMGINWATGTMQPAPLGTTFVFGKSAVQEWCRSKKFNLDDFLTYHLLKGISSRRNPSAVLIWFFLRNLGPAQDFIALSISSQEGHNFDWLMKLPGFFEQGEETVDPKARPYAFWDGKNLRRVHLIDFDNAKRGQLATDFFAETGLLVGTTTDSNAERIRQRDQDCWEYSLVPDTEQQIVDCNGKRAILLHSAGEIKE